MSLVKPLSPKVGNRVSATNFRDQIIDPLYQNDTALEDRIAILEAAIALIPFTFIQDTVPNAAKFKDSWVSETDNNQHRVCIEEYDGAESNKLGKWIDIHDFSATSNALQALTTAGTATKTLLNDTVPNEATVGYIWVDTDNSNRTFICNESYLSTDGPDAFPTLEAFRESKWEATTDFNAQLLAAAEQGLKDGKVNIHSSSTVPISADARDGWLVLSSKAFRVCIAAYTDTDGLPWSSTTDYLVNAIVAFGGVYYQATSPNSNLQPDNNPSVWNNLGSSVFANITLFRESRWIESDSPGAVALAQAAQATADGKIDNFIISPSTTPPAASDFPSKADIKDLLIDTTDSKQVYICIDSYDENLDVNDRPSKWEKTTDPAAQLRADIALNQADRKATVYTQDTVPSGAENPISGYIEKGDGWIDTNDNNASRGNVFKYKKTGAYQTITHFVDDGRPHNNTTIYNIGDVVRKNGFVYTSIQDGNQNNPPPNVSFWDDNVGKTTDVDDVDSEANLALWREEQWVYVEDKRTRDLLLQAQSILDGKMAIYYSSNPPSADVLGVDIKKGDGWFHTTERQFYISNELQAVGSPEGIGSVTYWDRSEDSVAKSIADDALAAVDLKRTTFVTAINDIDTTSLFPGPGTELGQIPIADWASIGGAKQGDLWVNIDPLTSERRTKVCVTAYSGYAPTGIGAPGNWSGYDQDKAIKDQFDLHLDLAGTKPMTGEIQHTANQDFNGRSVSVTQGGSYGSTVSVDGAPTANNHVVRKQEHDTKASKSGDSISGDFDMNGNKVKNAGDGTDPQDYSTIAQLLGVDATAQAGLAAALARVIKSGDIMTGALTIEHASGSSTNPGLWLKHTNGAIRLGPNLTTNTLTLFEDNGGKLHFITSSAAGDLLINMMGRRAYNAAAAQSGDEYVTLNQLNGSQKILYGVFRNTGSGISFANSNTGLIPASVNTADIDATIFVKCTFSNFAGSFAVIRVLKAPGTNNWNATGVGIFGIDNTSIVLTGNVHEAPGPFDASNPLEFTMTFGAGQPTFFIKVWHVVTSSLMFHCEASVQNTANVPDSVSITSVGNIKS